MRHRLAQLILVFAAASSAACGAGCTAAAPARTPDQLPAVELSTLDAKPASLARATQGKVALVNLWATWCTSCEKEFDALNRLDARAREHGGMVLGIAVGEPTVTVADFVRRRGLAYAQLIDEDFKLADAVGERRVPTTLVLNRQGRVIYTGGALDDAALSAFRAAIAE
jgi:peroxiredoxin